MEETFAAALASTIVPGGKLANAVDVPSAGQLIDEAGLSDWIAHPRAGRAVTAIRAASGGDRAFVEAVSEKRVSILKAVQAEQQVSFAELVASLLKLYYEHPSVLQAFGWHTAPPQPNGYSLDETDWSLFEQVSAGGPIWREV